ncbi:DUF4912 domain-containing protein [Cyanobacterium aponinum UTEX 3222]|uniref:DUF4912 domain-containing protein n=1 Tax=Cyanobacterium aponinum TaxID=379064 RepID=UPI00308EB547|nr:DUF4912 domain-containing protein [Cyanobacterium aponinum UTEX 3222]
MTEQKQTLEEMTLRQLRKIASILNIPRYSRMRKQQLLNIIKTKKNDISSENSNPSNNVDNQAKKSLNRLSPEGKSFLNRRTQENNPPDLTTSSDTFRQNVRLSSLKNLPDNFFFGIDENLGDLPESYGEEKVMLLPLSPQWGYIYWDISPQKQKELRNQGGKFLALRLYDVTDIDYDSETPHNVKEFLCGDVARAWYVPIPVSDRIYAVDIGYRCEDGRWLAIARSPQVKIPSAYPSEWVEDVFVTIPWEEDLKERKQWQLSTTGKSNLVKEKKDLIPVKNSSIPENFKNHSFGSWMLHRGDYSPNIWASGIGLMSGSGAGFSGDLVWNRKFWLIANAELIVYGATDPRAKVIVGDTPISLNPDGTFHFHIPFPDGQIDYPIKAIAPDGEQTRSIHLRFNRDTISENTNKEEEATLEWFTSPQNIN